MTPSLRAQIESWSCSATPAPAGWQPAGAAALQDRRVLVTGAGGSIGSALVNALRRCGPSELVLIEQSEEALFQLERARTPQPEQVRTSFLLGNCGDRQLLQSTFHRHGPQIVFHTAAYKHVPLLETNPFAAVKNNVLHTHTLLDYALAHGAEHFVLVSTDKAVDPASIMGATKRMNELLLLSRTRSATRLSAVRLGNVWGSRGSVVPVFLERIAHGLPLLVTDPCASRFFLSIDDAVAALIAALASRPGGTVLLPDLPPPTPIVEIARTLIAMHGGDSTVAFGALRPGEKLTEALYAADETMSPAPGGHGLLRVVQSPCPSLSALEQAIRSLREAVRSHDLGRLIAALAQCVPGYLPSALIRQALYAHDGVRV